MGKEQETAGLTIALHEAGELVDQLLDLALGAASADRVALLLIEDDGTLACRGMRGRELGSDPPPIELSGALLAALEATEPVVVDTVGAQPFPPGWSDSLAGRTAMLAPLVTRDGPLGLLVLGWDTARPGDGATDAATTATFSLVLILEAAIASEVERSRSFWDDRMPEEDRERVGRSLAAIYLRSGLLRLVLEDGLADDVAEIEALAFEGLRALRGSEASRGDARIISDELFHVLVELTGD